MPNDVLTDVFRPLSRIFEPDPRQTCYEVIDETGTRGKTIQDHYNVIERLVLNPTIPRDVAIQFDTAKKLFVHAWCNLRFTQIAERHAYSAVEMALRQRLNSDWTARVSTAKKIGKRINSRPTLPLLLRLAIDLGIITDSGFRNYERIRQRRADYLNSLRQVYGDDPKFAMPSPTRNTNARILSESMPSIRNSLAHGSTTIYPGVYLQFELCCDILNQLYP